MRMPIETTDRPPSYTETALPGSSDDVVQPTILVLAGQSIHPETASCAPLYHLDRGIASLSRVTSKVLLERVEHTVRTSVDNEPSIRNRRRHVFTLERSWTIYNTLPSSCPQFFARAVSKRAIGHIALKKARLHSAFAALPVDVAGRDNKLGLPGFISDAQPLFELHRRDDRWKWADKDGNAVAIEDESDDMHRLLLTATLPRVMVDALVALWCCRLWEYSAEHTEDVQRGIDGIRNKLKLGKEANVSGLRGWVI
ncbi:hypothetical protein F5Y07DRAFT_149786 [Xylaria sp. FL0933]|nr:hypothetical protein F5Y07DRAFT_149786 [Xylaria sp. FL0933]